MMNELWLRITQFKKNVANDGNINPYPHIERVLDSMIEPVQPVPSPAPVTDHSVPLWKQNLRMRISYNYDQ